MKAIVLILKKISTIVISYIYESRILPQIFKLSI